MMAAEAGEPWKTFLARQRAPALKRDAVLQTAAHMFLEQSYRRTSLSELAKRLNITKPALYYYFRNKEEILVACYREGTALIEEGLDQAIAKGGTGLEKVKAYIQAYAFTMIVQDFGRCVVMLDDGELSESARGEVRKLKRRIDRTLRNYIAQGIEDGSIEPCDAKLAAFAIAGAVNWIGSWYRPSGSLPPEVIAREFSTVLTRGLASRNGKQKLPLAAGETNGYRARQKRKIAAAGSKR